MPKIQEWLLTSYADLVARRLQVAADNGAQACREGGPGGQEAQEIARLLAVLEERNRLIERLKLTDLQRELIHVRMKTRWNRKLADLTKARAQLRVMRRLLQARRSRIRSLLEEAKRTKSRLSEAYSTPGIRPFQDASPPPPKGFLPALVNRLISAAPPVTSWMWRHWMRLGVLKQYAATPIQPDRHRRLKTPVADLPTISVVTPSFNQAQYLDETMRSVLEQEYPKLEYIVMDGGSTDASVETIRRHAAKLSHWQSGPDGGQAAAVREGLEKATGEIMAWVNSDDLLMPGTLALVADYFARHPDVDVVYGHRIIINETSHEVGRWVLPAHDRDLLLWVDFIPQETVFWRRSVYEKAGGLDPAFRFTLDWDLFLRMQKAGAVFVRLPWFLGAFRMHQEQKNVTTLATDGYPEMASLRSRELGGDFSRHGLARRVNRAQFKAVILTWMLRLGIRW